jgi:hypothetical protein
MPRPGILAVTPAVAAVVERAVDHAGHCRTVLTPVNDPISHHDHFHVEADVDYTP